MKKPLIQSNQPPSDSDQSDSAPVSCFSYLKSIVRFLGDFFFLTQISGLFTLYNRFIRKKKIIELTNLKDVLYAIETQELKRLTARFYELYEKKCNENNSNQITEFQFFIIILKIFLKDIIYTSLLWYFSILAVFFTPTFLSKILEKLNLGEMEVTYYWIFGFTIMMLLQLLFTNNFYSFSYRLSAKFRLTLIRIMYMKILRLNKNSIQQANIGKVINIISNNMNLIELNLLFFVVVLVLPITLATAFYFLWSAMKFLSFYIVVLFFAVYLIQIGLSFLNKRNIEKKNMLSDKRIKLSNDLIEGIRLLKMYCYELSIKKYIDSLRSQEIVKLVNYNIVQVVGKSIFGSISTFAGVLVYYLMYLTMDKSLLNPSNVFFIFQILDYVCYYQVNFVSSGLLLVSDLRIILRRMLEIISIQEPILEPIKNDSTEKVLILENFSSYWSLDSSVPTISNMNLSFEKGKLYGIFGKVGSGKSSFLYSLIGETPKYIGKIFKTELIALVEQEPFILEGTVRENILFYRPLNKLLYQKVLYSCCLEEDLMNLNDYDQTQIGEKGINLSGGQKIRICLARALYSEAELYLLDDPLSALDAKIGRQIFERAIKGLLKDKCTILVTHQLQYMSGMDYIYQFEAGKICKKGRFEDFQKEFKNSEHEKTKLTENLENLEQKNEELSGLKGRKLYSAEDPEGSIGFEDYLRYIKYADSYFLIFFTLLLFVLCEVNKFIIVYTMSFFGENLDEYNTIFTVLLIAVLSYFFFFLAKYYTFNAVIFRANRNLHNKLTEGLVRAPVSFFDTHQSGLILNRLSNDLGLMDSNLVMTLNIVVEYIILIMVTMIILLIENPYFIVVLAILFFFFLIFYRIGKPILINIRKIDLINKSPIFTFFNSTLSGLTMLNVYGKSSNFMQNFDVLLENSYKANFYYWEINRGFGASIDLIGKAATFLGAFMTIWLLSDEYSNGIIGQILLYLISLSTFLSYAVRRKIICDEIMASSNRVQEYCQIPPEASLTSPHDLNLPSEWPSQGQILIKNVYMKYAEHLDFSLKGVTISIKPGEKIGVVGRTGSGKSSIIRSIFRIFEINSGEISVDGVNLLNLGLHTFRKKLSIIPQSPFVFSGSLKLNLNPSEDLNDEALWNVLEIVGLKEYVLKLKDGILTELGPQDNIFSVGQKQLLCLARALLQRNKIFLLDEATANIDTETDKLLQQKIKILLKDCTILTIAHRLLTIADYDKVVVVDNGSIAEFGKPYKLLTERKGIFAEMVRNTDPSTEKKILEEAKRHMEIKKNR